MDVLVSFLVGVLLGVFVILSTILCVRKKPLPRNDVQINSKQIYQVVQELEACQDDDRIEEVDWWKKY